MSGGIDIDAATQLFSNGISVTQSTGATSGNSSAPATVPTPASSGAWRPPQWSQPALYMITIPPQYNIATPSNGVNTITAHSPTGSDQQTGTEGGTAVIQGTGTAAQTAVPKYLVFDGIDRSSHSQEAKPTKYPVQTQANFTDHVILEPARLTLDIIMSDAMQAYAAGQWVGGPSKSISCFMVLDALRAARVPLTVSTRLKTYTGMVLTNVVPEESVKTLHGLRARVEFQQIFIATVASTAAQGVSARQQTNDNTTLGLVNVTPVPSGVTSQNGLPAAGAGSSASLQQTTTGSVIGAGNWSSNNTSALTVNSDPVPFPSDGGS